MKIIVFGGTGFIGRYVCERLVRAGHTVTVPTRRLEHARSVQMLPGLVPLACDVRDAAQLAQRIAGHDVLINLIAVLQGDEARFDEMHVQLPQRLAAACVQQGVKRVVHVSSLGVSTDAPSRYLRSKARGEAVWQEAVARHGLSVAIVRPSVVFGPEDKLTNLFARLNKSLPVLPLAGSEAMLQPVWVADVAQAICQLASPPFAHAISARSPQGGAHIVEAAGPQVMSLRQLVSTCGELAGSPRPVLALPGPVATLQALMMELAPGEPMMSRDNLASLKVPNVASGRFDDLPKLGIQPASLSAIAPDYLRLNTSLDRYRQHAQR
jgi:uncharacterized protein YbjT (DUF2867 family)